MAAHCPVAVAGMRVETDCAGRPAMDYGGIHHPHLALHFVDRSECFKDRIQVRRNREFVEVPTIIRFGLLVPCSVTITRQNNTDCLVYYSSSYLLLAAKVIAKIGTEAATTFGTSLQSLFSTDTGTAGL
jgi:hypothetical protein